MLAIDCPCGHRLEAPDSEALFQAARDHIDRDHPDMERTDEQIRERIAADAYDPAARDVTRCMGQGVAAARSPT